MRSACSLPETCSDYYELLGIPPFESDVTLINAKVRDLMREARKYQVGQYAAQAERHLNLLAAATACLSNPQQKRAYDDELRQQWGLPPVTVSITVAVEGTRTQPLVPLPAVRVPWYRLVAFLVLATSCVVIIGSLIRSTGDNGGTDRLEVASLPAVPQSIEPASTPQAPLQMNRPVEAPSSAFPRQAPAQPAEPGNRRDAKPQAGPSAQPAANSAASSVAASGNSRPPAPAARPEPVAKPLPAPAVPVPAEPDENPPAPRPPPREPKQELEFDLSGDEVIRELKSIRVRRGATGESDWRQALRLVRYGQAAFPDDRRFMRQLQVEITALRRLFPELRDSLQDVPR